MKVEQNWTFTDTPIGPIEFDVDMLITEAKGRKALRVNAQFLQPSPFVPGVVVTYELKRLHRLRGDDDDDDDDD